MNLKRKKVISALIVLLFLVIIFVMCMVSSKINFSNNTSMNKKQEIIDLQGIVQYMLDTDSFDYDQDIMAAWAMDDKQQLLEESRKEDSAEVNFVRGSLAVYNSDYNLAIDDFNECIKSLKRDSDIRLQARVYYELSKVYIYVGEYDASIEAADKMEELYKDKINKDYLIQLNIWRSYDVLDMPDGVNIAVELMEDTYKIAKETNFSNMEDVLFKLGRAYGYADNNVKAMDYKLKALTIAESHGNSTKMMDISVDLGIDFLYYGNYSKALDYLKKAYSYEIEDEEIKQETKVYILNNIVYCYVEEEDYENAKLYLNEEEKMIEKENEGKRKEDDMTNFIATKAELEIYLGHIEEAFDLVDEAKKRYDSSSSFYYNGFDLRLDSLYGKAYYEMGYYETALRYFKGVEEKTLERGMNFQEECVKDLYKVYRKLGDYDQAFKYSEMLYDKKSEQYEKQKSQHEAFMLEEFESKKKEEKIKMLERKNDNMKILFVVLILVLALITTGVVVILKKNREINSLNKLFKNLSEIDELTQIANRRALNEFLDSNWINILKEYSMISIAMMDVDFFKKYNDNYGHQNGDKVLVEIARVMKESCRKNTDFVARYGGEEFIIIMPGTQKKDSIAVLERIQKGIASLKIEHQYSEVSQYITLSMGVVTIEEGTDIDLAYENVIKRADEALYEAKKTRNTIVHK